MCALVEFVDNAIAIGILRLRLGIKCDAQHGSTGKKRNRRITISGRHAMFADVINRIILAILDIFLVIEARLEETSCHFETDGEFNAIRQVEAETRSNEHRVMHRTEFVTTLALQTHFTGEFQERSHPGESIPVDTRAIDERIGLIGIVREDIACSEVPCNRRTNLRKVECSNKACTESPVIRRKRMRVLLAVQVPSVTRTDTGIFFTSREVHVEHKGGLEESRAIGSKRETNLRKHVQVTAASRPHIIVTSSATICVGMFIVNRKRNTDIDEVENADVYEEVTGLGVVRVIERVSLSISFEDTSARQAPRTDGNISAGTDAYLPLP